MRYGHGGRQHAGGGSSTKVLEMKERALMRYYKRYQQFPTRSCANKEREVTPQTMESIVERRCKSCGRQTLKQQVHGTWMFEICKWTQLRIGSFRCWGEKCSEFVVRVDLPWVVENACCRIVVEEEYYIWWMCCPRLPNTHRIHVRFISLHLVDFVRLVDFDATWTWRYIYQSHGSVVGFDFSYEAARNDPWSGMMSLQLMVQKS